jgi:hypothetical protein
MKRSNWWQTCLADNENRQINAAFEEAKERGVVKDSKSEFVRMLSKTSRQNFSQLRGTLTDIMFDYLSFRGLLSFLHRLVWLGSKRS